MILLRFIIQMLNNLKYVLFLSLCFNNCSFASSDSTQPLKIQADTANLDHAAGVAEYDGNVNVDQGSRHLSSDHLTIIRNAHNKIEVIIATGSPATFHAQEDPKKPKGTGSAKTIKYYPAQDCVDLLDEAELSKDGDTITGPILNYNFTSGNLQTNSKADKRVTFVLQPKREP